ncbi:V-set domain containing T-cell activation inhibitor 1-like isoform X1 [Astatotilapia calliptera]|uniref:V-set domain containing T-cell activation inhibitor 1-like isoform X1 n=1 Tax=Astatotilapia calliptera TaxID=8154 RepID=UPI00064591E5|nr:V-set domain containing T-cell activation inhibitor 1-like isoform X1 [Astatotilapia calliptera]
MVRQRSSYLLLWIFLTIVDGDTEVSCVFMERCVLPCSFKIGNEIVIHWFKTPRDLHVHSFYYSRDQLGNQDQYYRNRTSLFKDQISSGNASLQLTSVEVQDEGRYKCHTSTITGNQESFVNLKVDAPVNKVKMNQVENRISCRSEGIYPEPQLTWSTSPPSNITFTNTTTVERTEQLLYNISSSQMLSAGVYHLLFICTISTRRNRRRATLQRLSDISGPSTGVTIPCTPSNTSLTNFTLLWRFNHTQTVLSQSWTDVTYSVSDGWRQKVENVSKSGSLMLKDLSTKQEGMYTCKLSNAEETHITHIHLRITEGARSNTAVITTAVMCGLVLIGLSIAALISIRSYPLLLTRYRHAAFVSSSQTRMDSVLFRVTTKRNLILLPDEEQSKNIVT